MRVSWRAVRSAAAVQAVQCVDDHAASFQSGSIPLDPGTPVSSRDRDFRPSRRRGFDDDNFETPRRDFGCRGNLGGNPHRSCHHTSTHLPRRHEHAAP